MNFTLNDRLLKYFNKDCIWIYKNDSYWKNNPKWKLISICNHNGYKFINIGIKKYLLHRIIGYLFLGLNIDNPKEKIDHIDGNPSNNKIENLRIVSHQQNHFNRITAKGYCFYKRINKFQAQIILDGKTIYLGCYDTEEESHKAYLDAKAIYHVID